LFLISSMEGGGAERVAALLCNHWANERHLVTLMPTFSGRGECDYPLDRRVRLDFLADRVGAKSQTAFQKVRRFISLRRAVSELRPDVIVSFMTRVNSVALLAGWGMGIRTVVSERTYPPAMPMGSIVEALRRWTYPWAATVVMQSEQGRRWLNSHCPKARAKVIPNPVTYPVPISGPIRDPSSVVSGTRRVILSAGRLESEKGFDSLIESFSMLAESFPDWDLVLVGEGTQRGRLEALRDKLGLNDRILLPGRVGNVGDWYERADLYVLSSRFEGFPNTLLEAMAYGLPVVSFDCDTGPRDIIHPGIDGLLVASEAGAAGLAEALARLLKDPVAREQMGAKAVGVRQRYSIEKIAGLWDEALGVRR
jgi:GalNAc-alpha-(1->4)-GalNAc-alpha-(1->3)-diNAcBac-PP-undecaprenol alpha-1,4-N-acetyl-D-galactosaminyltransferase